MPAAVLGCSLSHDSRQAGSPPRLTAPILPARPQVGWKHNDAVAELEATRKASAQKFYEAKKKALAVRAKAVAQVGA